MRVTEHITRPLINYFFTSFQLKETVKTKRESNDAKLRNLHQSMVVKQPKPTEPKKQAKPPKVSDKNVSQELEQMKF